LNSDKNNPIDPAPGDSPAHTPISSEAYLEMQAAASAEPKTLGQWLRVNGVMLVAIAAVIGFVCMYWDVWAVAKVALGLGFIIFIHELGHFLVAKWCDVHVTTFSIGFGPALPFCSWTWGETTYKLAAFPLGGYVQMVGQVDGDETAEGDENDPRSYRNKSVWQRMAIISAGVTMNAIFACVAFTVIFLGPGKPRQAAVIDTIDSGKPAFVEGLRSSSEILKVNDIDRPFFEDLKYETMGTLNEITLVSQRRFSVDPLKDDVDKSPVTTDITPHQGPLRVIGIQPTNRLQLAAKKSVPPGYAQPAWVGSAAARAEPKFQFSDILVGVTDPDAPSDAAKMPLRMDPRNPDGNMRDYFEFLWRMHAMAGKEVTIQVQRGSEKHPEIVNIKVPPAWHKTLGARMKMGQITAIRKGSAAAEEGVVARPTEDGAAEGDVIEKVEVREADGTPIVWEKGKNLDPVRLPYQLKQWAALVWKKHDSNPPQNDRMVKLWLKRQSKQNAGQLYTTTVVSLPWDYTYRNDRVAALSANSPEPIAELGLGYQIKNDVDGLEEGASGAGLEKDDQIVEINFVEEEADGTTKDGGWQSKAIKGVEWAKLFRTIQAPYVAKVKMKVKRAGEIKEIEVVPHVDRTWPLDDRGLMLAFPDLDVRIERADNILDAIKLGFRDTHRTMMQIYMHLRGLVAGTISVENLGGPVAITTTAYRVAQYDFWEFVFFLGLISVNLAVLNFLPIPVLDGGHMVFLLYEKLRGKPASEGVRVGATYAGLLLLGCLMIFVFLLDIRRLVSG
jgi:regulator of sigma E protease